MFDLPELEEQQTDYFRHQNRDGNSKNVQELDIGNQKLLRNKSVVSETNFDSKLSCSNSSPISRSLSSRLQSWKKIFLAKF